MVNLLCLEAYIGSPNYVNHGVFFRVNTEIEASITTASAWIVSRNTGDPCVNCAFNPLSLRPLQPLWDPIYGPLGRALRDAGRCRANVPLRVSRI